MQSRSILLDISFTTSGYCLIQFSSDFILRSSQIGPLELLSIGIIFWYFVRYMSLIAAGYTILLIASQMIFGELFVLFRLVSRFEQFLLCSKFLFFRTRILKFTDERMKVMSEILRSMRVVKMYSWEATFEKKIISIRQYA